MEDKSTSGLDPFKLAQLLSLASSEDADLQMPGPLTEQDFLQLLLAQAVPGVPVGSGLPPSAGQLLNDPAARLDAIETINRNAKRLASASAIEAERAAATAVYYATIAHAKVYHHAQISRLSDSQLADALADLESRPWISPQLVKLFALARSA